MGMFNSLYTASDAIRVNQTAISVINNNIANMNTEGYSKQRVDLQQGAIMPSSLYELVNVPIGGVEIESITRNTDTFLDSYYRQENSELGYYKQMSDSLGFIEEYFNELNDNGITGAMTSFYAAAQEMSMDPTNRITRANFLQSAESVAREFNSTYEQLLSYRESLIGDGTTSSMQSSQVYSVIETINSNLDHVAELNKQISTFSSQDGVEPNTLLDERQRVLNEISEYIPIHVSYSGSCADVTLGNVTLVENQEVQGAFLAVANPAIPPDIVSPEPLTISFESSSFVLIDDYQNFSSEESGQLKALLTLGGDGDDSINNLVGELNVLAQEFARSVNDIQIRQETNPAPPNEITNASMCMNGITKELEIATEYIFFDDASTTSATLNPNDITAGNIQINQAVIDDPYRVATAYVLVDPALPQTPPLALDPNGIGDNNNATAFANSRNTSIAALDGFNVEDKMSSIISTVGSNTAVANNSREAQEASVDHVNEKRQSVMGVNLDEELMDLVKYQNSYNASARVLSVIDEMLQLMIGLLK